MKTDIQQIDGKYYQRCFTKLLHTQDASHIHWVPAGQSRADGSKLENDIPYFTPQRTPYGYPPMHLYFLSDGEINIGDYYLNEDKKIHKSAYGNLSKAFYKDCKKIIASTNSELNVPSIEPQFIKAYCEKGGIDELMVEMDEHFDGDTIAFQKAGYKPNGYKLKVSQNNTITIKPINDTYSRKEIEVILKEYCLTRPNYDPNHIREWMKETL